ncbi:MAG: hypothetical protein ABSG53_29305, partial [Thermoguttaceae bacterium]
MIRGRYGLLIAAVVVAMLSAAAGAGFLMIYSPLPDPSVATRQQLFQWLVLRDLSQEPVEIRQKILLRLDTEFGRSGDMDSTIENLEDSHRQTLWHNVTVLFEPWLLSKVQQYSQLPGSQKTEYIDCFLDRAELWNQVGAACLKNSASQGPKGGSSVTKLIMEQIQQCSNRAAPEQRQQIGAFMVAAQSRWLWRQLPSFKVFGKPAS